MSKGNLNTYRWKYNTVLSLSWTCWISFQRIFIVCQIFIYFAYIIECYHWYYKISCWKGTWTLTDENKIQYWYTEKLFISIFTIVFFNLGKNVPLWEFLLVKILNFIIMIWNFSINYSKYHLTIFNDNGHYDRQRVELVILIKLHVKLRNLANLIE